MVSDLLSTIFDSLLLRGCSQNEDKRTQRDIAEALSEKYYGNKVIFLFWIKKIFKHNNLVEGNVIFKLNNSLNGVKLW